MSSKPHLLEEIVAKLQQVEVPAAQGRPMAEAIDSTGVTEVTISRWRQEHGGLKRHQDKGLMELMADNARLWPVVSHLTLVVLRELPRGSCKRARRGV